MWFVSGDSVQIALEADIPSLPPAILDDMVVENRGTENGCSPCDNGGGKVGRA